MAAKEKPLDSDELEVPIVAPAKAPKLSGDVAKILQIRKQQVATAQVQYDDSGTVNVFFVSANGKDKRFSFAKPSGVSDEEMQMAISAIVAERFKTFLNPENFYIVSEREGGNKKNVVTADGSKYTL